MIQVSFFLQQWNYRVKNSDWTSTYAPPPGIPSDLHDPTIIRFWREELSLHSKQILVYVFLHTAGYLLFKMCIFHPKNDFFFLHALSHDFSRETIGLCVCLFIFFLTPFQHLWQSCPRVWTPLIYGYIHGENQLIHTQVCLAHKLGEGPFRIFHSHNLHVFALWEETRVPIGLCEGKNTEASEAHARSQALTSHFITCWNIGFMMV